MAGADADLDLAVIAVETGDVAPVDVGAGRRGELTLGAPVFALANPSGRGLRTTFGLVSATGRSFRGPRGRRDRAARSSTPRRSRAAPPAGRWSTPTAACSASTPCAARAA